MQKSIERRGQVFLHPLRRNYHLLPNYSRSENSFIPDSSYARPLFISYIDPLSKKRPKILEACVWPSRTENSGSTQTYYFLGKNTDLNRIMQLDQEVYIYRLLKRERLTLSQLDEYMAKSKYKMTKEQVEEVSGNLLEKDFINYLRIGSETGLGVIKKVSLRTIMASSDPRRREIDFKRQLNKEARAKGHIHKT